MFACVHCHGLGEGEAERRSQETATVGGCGGGRGAELVFSSSPFKYIYCKQYRIIIII